MDPWLVVAIAGIVPLYGIMGMLHVYHDKLCDLLEGIILVMKYVVDKEYKGDDNSIFRNKDN